MTLSPLGAAAQAEFESYKPIEAAVAGKDRWGVNDEEWIAYLTGWEDAMDLLCACVAIAEALQAVRVPTCLVCGKDWPDLAPSELHEACRI